MDQQAVLEGLERDPEAVASAKRYKQLVEQTECDDSDSLAEFVTTLTKKPAGAAEESTEEVAP